jgi:hypothetical protein
MAGHPFFIGAGCKDVDGRDKRGHDPWGAYGAAGTSAGAFPGFCVAVIRLTGSDRGQAVLALTVGLQSARPGIRKRSHCQRAGAVQVVSPRGR